LGALKKIRGPWARAHCVHWLRRPWRFHQDVRSAWSPAHQLTGYINVWWAMRHCGRWTAYSKAVQLSNHVLHVLLPPSSTASQRYNLRHRAHSLQLPEHSTRLSDSDFMIYKNTYYAQFYGLFVRPVFLTNCIAFLLCCWPAFCHIDWLIDNTARILVYRRVSKACNIGVRTAYDWTDRATIFFSLMTLLN